MMNGFKVQYDDPNGNKLDHWDEAKNIAYNKENSSLASDNVQTAIDELSRFSHNVQLSDFVTDIDIDGVTTRINYDFIKAIKVSESIRPSSVDYNNKTVEVEDFREYLYCGSDTQIDFDKYKVANYKNPRFWTNSEIINIVSIDELPATQNDNTYCLQVYDEDRFELYKWVGSDGDTLNGAYQKILGCVKKLTSTSALPQTKAEANCIYLISNNYYIWVNDEASTVLEHYEVVPKTSTYEYSHDIAVTSKGSTKYIFNQINAVYYGQADMWKVTVPEATYVYVCERPFNIYSGFFESYSNPRLVDSSVEEIPTQVVPTSTYFTLLQNKFAEDNATYISDGEIVRQFIQNAIDYAATQQAILVFPKEEEFQISLYKASSKTYIGLITRYDSVIDLNSSTIRCRDNSYTNYHIIHIPHSSKNTIIRNGAVLGDRLNHFCTTNAESSQYNYGIQVEASNTRLINLKVGDVYGDGIYLESPGHWNHTSSYIFYKNKADNNFTEGVINSYGVFTPQTGTKIFATVLKNGTKTVSQVLSTINSSRIGGELHTVNDIFICLKPIDDITKLDYTLDPIFDIYFYVGNNENNFLTKMSVRLGDKGFKMPNQVNGDDIYYRVVFRADTTLDKLFTAIWPSAMIWQYGATISNCEIKNCGRNGIVPTSLRNLLIEDCYIHDIGGNTNQVGIDFEGSTYLDGAVTVRRVRFDNIGRASIGLSQGVHYIIDDCDLTTINGNNPDVHITNSVIRGRLSFLPKASNNSTIYPRNTVDNCLILGSGISAYNAIIRNCIIANNVADIADARANITQYKNARPTFENCVFKGPYLLVGDYINCKFITTNITLNWGKADDEFNFDHCNFDISRITTMNNGAYPKLNITNSNIKFNYSNSTDGRIAGVSIGLFTNNNVVYTEQVANDSIFKCRLSNTAYIVNNTFDVGLGAIAKFYVANVANISTLLDASVKDNKIYSSNSITLLSLLDTNATTEDKAKSIIYNVTNNVFTNGGVSFKFATSISNAKVVYNNNFAAAGQLTYTYNENANIDVITV